MIIQTAFPGDVVLTLPILQACRENFPDAEIDFLLIPATSNLLKNNPYVNKIIEYDKSKKEFKTFLNLISTLREEMYDVIISPHRSHRSALMSYLSGTSKSISFDLSSLSWLYDFRVNYVPSLHEIQRNLKLLEPLGIFEKEIIKPELFIGDEERSVIDNFFRESNITSQDKVISFAPGSVWFTKRFPKEKFVKIADILAGENLKIILTGGRGDAELMKYIRDNSYNKNIVNSGGRFSLLESAEVIRRSGMILANDSAPLHIANTVGTKVIAVFGSTITEFGFYPYGSHDAVVEVNGLKCRPCGIHGRNKCPIGTLECMYRIDEDEIVKLIRENG